MTFSLTTSCLRPSFGRSRRPRPDLTATAQYSPLVKCLILLPHVSEWPPGLIILRPSSVSQNTVQLGNHSMSVYKNVPTPLTDSDSVLVRDTEPWDPVRHVKPLSYRENSSTIFEPYPRDSGIQTPKVMESFPACFMGIRREQLYGSECFDHNLVINLFLKPKCQTFCVIIS